MAVSKKESQTCNEFSQPTLNEEIQLVCFMGILGVIAVGFAFILFAIYVSFNPPPFVDNGVSSMNNEEIEEITEVFGVDDNVGSSDKL